MYNLLVQLLLLYGMQTCVIRAAQLVREGDGAITGYTGTIFTAHNYRPICGVLARGQFTENFDVLDTCQPAMNQYRDTNDTFSLYSLTGVRLSDTLPIGRDNDVCMCFSLADLDDRKADLCIYVLKDGTTSDQFNNGIYMWIGRAIAAGSFHLGDKALPACFDIDYEAVTSSLDAMGDATRVQVQPPSTSTAHAPTGSSTAGHSESEGITSSPNESPSSPNATVTVTSNSSSPPRSTTPATGPAGLYVWLPILLTLLFGLIGVYYKRRRFQLEKNKAEKQRAQDRYY